MKNKIRISLNKVKLNYISIMNYINESVPASDLINKVRCCLLGIHLINKEIILLQSKILRENSNGFIKYEKKIHEYNKSKDLLENEISLLMKLIDIDLKISRPYRKLKGKSKQEKDNIKKITEDKTFDKENANLKRENEILNREIELRNDKIKKLKTKREFGDLTEEKLKIIIDETRKKNGKHNYSKIGRRLGINHETAKRLVNNMGLSKY